ncbi:MAG: GNAT family N-acetyltransferase [Candidatus Cloacimonetes bacterium]|nr:GNAT family N-acetyltransferase [Candidatus Cloacimonadota bacterium]
MKIIKEENLNHKVFKDYDNFTNILEIFRFESPKGYMIIRRSDKNFAIDFFSVLPIIVTKKLKEILVPYFKGDLFISLNENQKELKEYIQIQNMEYWFSTYNMLTDSIKEMTEGKIAPYNGELERYIYIFGKAFIPLRKSLGFVESDKFISNPKYAKKIFEETNNTGSFYGYIVNGKIIGAAYSYENDIESISIDPEFQGKGYGRQLLRGCVKNMLSKYKEVTLGVVEINTKAHKLYESEGFKVTSYRHNYKNFIE